MLQLCNQCYAITSDLMSSPQYKCLSIVSADTHHVHASPSLQGIPLSDLRCSLLFAHHIWVQVKPYRSPQAFCPTSKIMPKNILSWTRPCAEPCHSFWHCALAEFVCC